MKKTSFLVVLCFLTAAYSFGQVSFNPGLRAGVNFAKLTQVDSDVKVDFYVSGYGALQLSRYYTLQPELTYTRQGGKFDLVYYDYNQDIFIASREELTLSYVSFGLINKFTFTDKFNVHLGPSFDIIIDSYYDNYITPVDLAFMLGVGFNVTNSLAIEGRIKKGVVNVYEYDYYYSENPSHGDYNTNFLFQVGISYTFQLMRK